MNKLTPEEIKARLRGELGNFAKDTVEYFQNTGMVYPPNLESYAERITQLAKCQKQDVCPKCGGRKFISATSTNLTGYQQGKKHRAINHKLEPCPTCKGTGKYSESGRGSDGFEKCPECGGKGGYYWGISEIARSTKWVTCPTCKGTGKKTPTCVYCGKKADGAMLAMGNDMAHADCVIQKLNELLDPDYDGKGKPNKILEFDK